MDNAAPSMLKATLIGGAVAGFVGGAPLIGALNCLCCSLVISGGFLAAFLYSRDCRSSGAAFRPGNGATVGLVAGLFYALAHTVTSGLVQVATGTNMQKIFERVEEMMGEEMPPEAEPMIDFLVNANPFVLGGVLFCCLLLVAAVFSTIGGLIGGAAFKVEPATPAPPPGMPPHA